MEGEREEGEREGGRKRGSDGGREGELSDKHMRFQTEISESVITGVLLSCLDKFLEEWSVDRHIRHFGCETGQTWRSEDCSFGLFLWE